MKNSRLVQLLESFNRVELQELQQFIECEFFHSNKRRKDKVVDLFQWFISPEFKILKPEKKDLYVGMFGRIDKNMNKLNHYISQATDLLQKYLIYKYQAEDSERYKHTLLKALKKREIFKLFTQLKTKLESDAPQKTKKSIRDFFYSYEVANAGLGYRGVRDKLMKDDNADLETATSNLDMFFLLQELNYACQVLNNKGIMEIPEYKFPLLSLLINELPNTPHFEDPLLEMYWNAHQILALKDEVYFDTLKKLLFKHCMDLLYYHCNNLFTFLINYCVGKINSGDSEYYVDFWEISIFRLEKELTPKLGLAAYKNLITTGTMLALQQKKVIFTDIWKFMQQNKHRLPEKFRDEAESYAEAYVAFYQGNFKVVVQKLTVCQNPLTIYKFEDIFYQIDARRLLTMAYFCLKDDDNFDKTYSNLSVFLNERKDLIPEMELEKNRQFLIIIKKLFWLPLYKKERKAKLEELKNETEAAVNISDRTWLLKQIGL